MNWGYKILTTIILFLAGMIFMVLLASKQKNEMLDDNYYQKEIQFQSQIDASKNLQNKLVQAFINQQSNTINLQFPAHTIATGDSVFTEFLCLHNQSLDFKQVLVNNGEQHMQLPKPTHKTKYTLRVHWQSANMPYYYQSDVEIK